MKGISLAITGIFIVAALTGCSRESAVFNVQTLIASSPASLYNFTFFNRRNGWSTNSSGEVFITANGGREWKCVSPKLTSSSVTHFYDFLDQNIAWLFNESKDGQIVAYKTSDRGSHWTQKGKLDLLYPGGGVQVDFVDTAHGFIENTLPGMGLLPAVLYYTNNGGSTWKEINSTSHSVKSSNEMPFGGRILFSTISDGWLYGSPRGPKYIGGLYHTNDGGLKWHHIDFPVSKNDHNALMFFPSMIAEFPPQGLAVPVSFQKNGSQIDQKLYITTNNGLTWTMNNLPTVNLTSISFLNNGVQGWVTTMNGALYHTGNNHVAACW